MAVQEVCDKLDEYWSIVQSLLTWLKSVEHQAKELTVLAKNEATLGSQLRQLEVFENFKIIVVV